MNIRRTPSWVVVLAGCVLAAQAVAADGYLLDDAALDQVTAGTQGDAPILAEFGFSRSTGSGRTVSGSGTLALAGGAPDYALYLGDGAQGNLRSLVNVNAVNASVTVLMNLNINIDSVVQTVDQSNVTLRGADAWRAAGAPGPAGAATGP